MQNENENEEIISKICSLCEVSTQHRCQKCGKLVCQIYCSIQDPLADEDDHHKRIHIPGDNRCNKDLNYQCPECGDRMTSADELKDHKTKYHSEPQCFVCPRCKEIFSTNQSLNNHLIDHSNFPDFSFQDPLADEDNQDEQINKSEDSNFPDFSIQDP